MEIHEHPHHIHPDHAIIINDVKHMLASNYTSLLTHIDSHIDDNRRHISIEDRDRWDNKADKVSLYDLEMRLAGKADYADLTELKETVTQIKTVVNGNDGTNGINGTSAVTERELEYILQGKDYITDADLSAYATKQWCEDTFLKKSDYNPGNVSQETIDRINELIQEAVDNKEVTGYNDSELRTLITGVDSKIDDFIAQDEANVRAIIENILNQWDWISKLPAGITKYPMQWNDTLEAFIQYVINNDADGNGGTWSSITQKYNEIKNEVDSIRVETGDGTITVGVLASLVSNRIQENQEGLRTAVAEMTTMWAKLNGTEALDPSDPDYLKKLRGILDNYATYDYVISGFTSTANESGGFARQYADATSKITSLEGLVTTLNATSQVLTLAKTDMEHEIAEAKASIESKASLDDITSATAGLTTSAYVDESIRTAKAEMSARVDDVEASIRAYVDSNSGSVVSIDADKVDFSTSSLTIGSGSNTQLSIGLGGGAAEVYLAVPEGEDTTIDPGYIRVRDIGNSATIINGGAITVSDLSSINGAVTEINPGEIVVDSIDVDEITSNNLDILSSTRIQNNLLVTGSMTVQGTFNAVNGVSVGGVSPASGTFTTSDNKTVTVTNGIITSIS